MTGALDSMTFNPILQEGSVPADRGALWTRTTTAQQLARLTMPNTALILQRVSGKGVPDSFMPFGPSTSLGSDVGEFERYYVVNLRDQMLVWELDLDSGDIDGGVSVLAVVTVSDPVLVAASGVRDARGWTASAAQDVVNATLNGVSVVNLPDAVPALERALIHHRFDCGLSVRWAHVTIDPPPLVGQHLRKMAELKNDHALALQRIELDKERIAVEAERERDQQTLDELLRHTERVKSEAETEAKRVVEVANREASQLKRKAAEDATQVRGDAERKAKEVIDSAMREAERIELDAQEAAGQRNLERVERNRSDSSRPLSA